MIQEQGSKKAKSYCKKNSPDVSTTSKFLKVSFITNKKKHSTGAECMVECESDITTPTSPGGSGVYQHLPEFSIRKNNLLTSLPVLEKEYKMSFQLFINSLQLPLPDCSYP